MCELDLLINALIEGTASSMWSDPMVREAWKKSTSPTALNRIALFTGRRPGRPPGRAGLLSRDEEIAWIRTALGEPPPLAELVWVADEVRRVGLPEGTCAADWVDAAQWVHVVYGARGRDAISDLWRSATTPHELVEVLQMVDSPHFEQASPHTLVRTDVDYAAWEELSCRAIRSLVGREPSLNDLHVANEKRRAAGKGHVVWEWVARACTLA
jgi:hypothetical protein